MGILQATSPPPVAAADVARVLICDDSVVIRGALAAELELCGQLLALQGQLDVLMAAASAAT